jgi:hypothetical protein
MILMAAGDTTVGFSRKFHVSIAEGFSVCAGLSSCMDSLRIPETVRKKRPTS